MSSVQSRTLTINADNVTSYGTTAGNLNLNYDGCALSTIYGDDDTHIYTLNDAAKSILFPNSIAHPAKADLSFSVKRAFAIVSAVTSNGRIKYNGSKLVSGGQASQSEKVYSTTGTTDAAVTTSNKSSPIQLILFSGFFGYRVYMVYATFTLYFTRYDFSAVADSGMASASVSSSTGYDGDTITFTASLQSGYTFDGWYNGSTKVSSSQTYVHTVAGADMALTAKAIASTKTVTTKYGATIIATEQRMPPVAVSYGSTQIVSVSSGQTKTLNCLNNLMSSNLTVGGKTLLCANQIMNGNIIVSVS